MSVDKTAREHMTQQRQHQEQIQQSMLERSEEAIANAEHGDLDENAREALTTQRQKDQQIKASMLGRTEAEVLKANPGNSPESETGNVQ